LRIQTTVKIGFDSKLLPVDGGDPHLAVILLHGKDVGDSTMRRLAERWRGHFTSAIFAMPQFTASHAEVAGPRAASPYRSSMELALTAAELDKYIDQLRTEYGLENSQIVIAGYAEGMALALYHALRQKEKLCAVVGFSGDLQGFSDLRTEVESRPPVLLVHGEKDDAVSPATFLQNFRTLAEAGVPVSTCFRPGLGHEIDGVGADSAMFFVKGALAVHGHRPPKKKKLSGDLAASLKLVIWDLDDTLWQGTLDDADAIVPFESRVDAIRRLNRSGIVSAICSKNDFETARQKLEALDLWDEFVFPRIAFVPKGAALKSLIADMQLKPKNCLFIDDNEINLAEAKTVLPDLHVLDAKSEDCDVFLQKLVDAHAHVEKSRVEEYKALQSRVTEGQEFDGSRENFLQTCDIHVAIASSSDLIDFAPRIEELINRTNQLNYLKTRVQPGSMVDFVSEASLREGFALFAWDKFGYHGLVGFIAADVKTETLIHMAFSCRIMHMGIENVLLHRTFQRFRNLNTPGEITVKPEIPAWITVDRFNEPGIRARILAEENGLSAGNRDVRIRFMANCQSGVFSHFSGLRDVAEIDSHPRIFILSQVLDKSYLKQNFPPAVVHYIGSDYFNVMWPQDVRDTLETGLYEQCAVEFCEFLRNQGSHLLIVGTPSTVAPNYDLLIRGVTQERMDSFSNVWKKMAGIYDCVDFMDVDGFVTTDRMVDSVHFQVDASRDIARHIADWYHGLPSSLFEPELAQAV
jgi:FkbH-like protein